MLCRSNEKNIDIRFKERLRNIKNQEDLLRCGTFIEH